MKADILRRCDEFDRLIDECSNIKFNKDNLNNIIQFQLLKAEILTIL